jgi:hypothetical protein
VRLADGTYWLSLHGADKHETAYFGYGRLAVGFVDGYSVDAARFGMCGDDGYHVVVYFGLSYTREGTPFELLRLTHPLGISKNVIPGVGPAGISITHDEVGV